MIKYIYATNAIHGVNTCWCNALVIYCKLKSKGADYYDNSRKDKTTQKR